MGMTRAGLFWALGVSLAGWVAVVAVIFLLSVVWGAV